MLGILLLAQAAQQLDPLASDPVAAHVALVCQSPRPTSPDELAQRLTAPFTEPLDKLKAIHLWFAASFVYDEEGAFRGRPINDPIELYTTGRGVCKAITSLYVRMGKSVGIPVEEVRGESRELQWFGGRPASRWIPHSWIRLRTERGPLWIDPTFSLPGTLKGRVSSGIGWFLIPPQEMKHTHRAQSGRLPEEPNLSRDEIDAAPDWDWGGLGRHSIRPLELSIPPTVDQVIEAFWPVPPSCEVLVDLHPGGVRSPLSRQYAASFPVPGGRRILIAPPGPGWHLVRVMVKRAGVAEPFQTVGAIPIQAASVSRPVVFPEFYSAFTEAGGEIVAGYNGRPAAGTEFTIKLRIKDSGEPFLLPEQSEAVSSEMLQPFVKGEDGVWSWTGRLEKGRWRIGLRKSPDAPSFEIMLIYEVTATQEAAPMPHPCEGLRPLDLRHM